jgi:hypothetical protein
MEYIMSHQEVVNIGDTVGTSCIICGEPVLFSHNEFERFKKGLHVDSKVCNQCKAAVKWARTQMQKCYKGEQDE